MKYKYLAIFLAGVLIWLLGTIHGGFSNLPQSNFEKITDTLGWLMIAWGMIGDVVITYKYL